MTTRFWFQNTSTEPGTGTDAPHIRDLAAAQGSAGTVSNSAGNTTTDTEVMRFQRQVHVDGEENIAGSIRVTEITVDTVFSLEVRRYGSNGTTLLATGGRSAEFGSVGVHTFSLDASSLGWQEDDVIAITVFHRRVSGKGGNTFTVATGDADSFVDVKVVAPTDPIPPPENVQASISGDDILVTWNAVSGALSYNIQRELFDGESWGSLTSFQRLTNELIDNTVIADSLYRYRVQWEDSSNVLSEWSDWVEQESVSGSQDESGSSTININVSTEGDGTGEVQGSGASTVDINVSTEGQGTGDFAQDESGSSTVDINVSTEGQGFGDSEPTVTYSSGSNIVTAEIGAPQEQHESGSSTVNINVAAEGFGSGDQEQSEQGSSTVTVNVSSEGAGEGAVSASGASTVAVDITPEGQGQGTLAATGASTVDVQVTAEGQGTSEQVQNEVGSSTVDINVSTEGAGTGDIEATGSSTVVINVIPTGFGSGDQEQSEVGSSTVNISIGTEGVGTGSLSGDGSSTVDIDVSTEGQGTGILEAVGSSTVTINISSEGTGTSEQIQTEAGASTVSVAVAPEGQGTGTISTDGSSTVDVIVTATGLGVHGEVFLRNITVEFSPPNKSDVEFDTAQVTTSIDSPVVVTQIDSATLISPVGVDIPITDPFGYADARVVKDIVEGELDTHIGEPTGV